MTMYKIEQKRKEGNPAPKKQKLQSVCVQYFPEDPTNEETGSLSAKNYAFHVFGLHKSTTIGDIFAYSLSCWDIKNPETYVLTDQDHNDLRMISESRVTEYFAYESNTSAMFILREGNTKMKNMLYTQEKCVQRKIKSNGLDRKKTFCRYIRRNKRNKTGACGL